MVLFIVTTTLITLVFSRFLWAANKYNAVLHILIDNDFDRIYNRYYVMGMHAGSHSSRLYRKLNATMDTLRRRKIILSTRYENKFLLMTALGMQTDHLLNDRQRYLLGITHGYKGRPTEVGYRRRGRKYFSLIGYKNGLASVRYVKWRTDLVVTVMGQGEAVGISHS